MIYITFVTVLYDIMTLITCVCPTYKRPVQLANAIKCFLDQDYEHKELVILDDAQQYPDGLNGPGWRLSSVPSRFKTLGDKRNATVEMAQGEYIAVWDDDDAYLPWHLSACVAALKESDYTIPSIVWSENKSGLQPKLNNYLYHGAWSFRREVWERVEGYPSMQAGQDQAFLRRLKRDNAERANTIDFDRRPSYVYRWHTVKGHKHISAGKHNDSKRYKDFNKIPMEPQTEIAPAYERDWPSLVQETYDRLSPALQIQQKALSRSNDS